MKRLIALALLFTSFSCFTSCSAKYQVNEQEFWDAISMKNIQYLQYDSVLVNGLTLKKEMAPNISHSIFTYPEYEENYVEYLSGPMDEDESYRELRRASPEGSFKPGSYPSFDYTYPEKEGQDLVEMLEAGSITYQHFKFQNDMYYYSYFKLKFENKRLVWIDTNGSVDFRTIEYNYQEKDIKMPELGDK